MHNSTRVRKTALVRSSVITWQPARMRALLDERGWTMRELAARANLPAATLNSYVYGSTRPSPPVLGLLADTLQVATTDLAPLSDSPTLHEYRWHTALTVTDFAARLGLSVGRVSALLRAEDPLPDPAAWAHALGVDEDQVQAAWAEARRMSISGD